MNIALWIVQVLLAAAFFMAGAMKGFSSIESLAAQMPWVKAVPGALVRFIGAAEIAGALGLLLPSLLRIMPKLTPVAAVCLGVVMVLAGGMHATRGEFGALVPNGVLLGLALFVAYGRWKLAPIEAKK